MRTLQGSDRVTNGLKGIIILLLVVGVGQSFTSIPMLFATPTYYAQFTDTGGLKPGDKVQIAGVTVGTVRSEEIDGDKVVVGFGLGGRQIGTESRAAIRTETVLGRKNMAIEPRGSEVLKGDGVLPVGQTTTPYQLYDAFFDLSKSASGWDIDTVKQSLNVLSETIDQTYPNLTPALEGVRRFSDTIGKRDDQINQLLKNANSIAKVLGDRGEQVNKLLVNTQTLLAAFNDRAYAIDALLERVSAFSAQVEGVINDNPNLNHVLEQLRTVSQVLVDRKYDLMETLTNLGKFTASLAEGIASGPYFKTMLVNLVPYQILQPFVDAAFKKRGLDPEEFWRSAGLPSFRFPDPNGVRLPNGAPPPAPTPLEGTPENPGPAVPAGSPCSYTPAANGIPSPGNPLPCAGATVGPFGDNPYGPNYGPPNVVTSAPNPGADYPVPGISIAGVPGQAPPDVPGVPPAQPPVQGPAGSRTEPVGPVAGPYPPPPPPAPAFPPAPGGPGQELPPVGTPPFPGNPPFVPPDQVGGR